MWHPLSPADQDHPPIPVDNYPEYYARISANDEDDLEEEYSVGYCISGKKLKVGIASDSTEGIVLSVWIGLILIYYIMVISSIAWNLYICSKHDVITIFQ